MRRTLASALALALFQGPASGAGGLVLNQDAGLPAQVPALGAASRAALPFLWQPVSSWSLGLPAHGWTSTALKDGAASALSAEAAGAAVGPSWGALKAAAPPAAASVRPDSGEGASIVPAVERFERQFRDVARAQGVSERRLPYILSETGARTKYVFVLVHGMGESPEGMAQLARFYGDQGHNVLSVLLSGHGREDEALEPASYPEWERDMDQAVDFARELGSEVVLVGFSLGGVLALRAAQRRPVAGLVLLAPGLKLADSGAKYLDERMRRGERWSTDQPVQNNPYSNRLVPMRAYGQYMDLARQVQRDFQEAELSGSRIAVPVAVLASEADRRLDVDFLRRFTAFQGADVLIYDGARNIGHNDVIRPAGGFDPAFRELHRRWMSRLP